MWHNLCHTAISFTKYYFIIQVVAVDLTGDSIGERPAIESLQCWVSNKFLSLAPLHRQKDHVTPLSPLSLDSQAPTAPSPLPGCAHCGTVHSDGHCPLCALTAPHGTWSPHQCQTSVSHCVCQVWQLAYQWWWPIWHIDHIDACGLVGVPSCPILPYLAHIVNTVH